jgi:hypothetical protein
MTDKQGLGRLERVSARTAWSGEATEFTPWLSENLDVLSAALGLALTLRAREHRVGRYSLDLLLEDARGRTVIVENQFEQTDHDHLGKLMTYAAGTKADIVVWIAETFTNEHIAALEWLNASTIPGGGFFAVQLEVLRIGSERAPHFQVLVRPNEWVQEAHREAAERSEWSWDSYESELHVPYERIEIGRRLLADLEAAVAERELPWQTRFRKGYVAIQRPGGYNVAVVDVYWHGAPRLALKLPESPDRLGLENPYPNLRTSWGAAEREWEWSSITSATYPDVGLGLDLVRRYQPASGPSSKVEEASSSPLEL